MSATKNFYFQEICEGLENAKQTKLAELEQKSVELTEKFMAAKTDEDIAELNIEATILKNQFKIARV